MDDLTRYLELADRLTAKFRDMNGEQQWDLRVEDIEAAQSAIRALVERVRTLSAVILKHNPSYDSTCDCQSCSEVTAALAQGKPGEADEFSPPTSEQARV